MFLKLFLILFLILFLTLFYNLEFKFNLELTAYLIDYDVIVIDECSILSREMYTYFMQIQNYLRDAGHNLKIIFLGDYGQLPPVDKNGNKKNSIVFRRAIEEKWPVIKLETVMRSENQDIYDLNQHLIKMRSAISRAPKRLIKK